MSRRPLVGALANIGRASYGHFIADNGQVIRFKIGGLSAEEVASR